MVPHIILKWEFQQKFILIQKFFTIQPSFAGGVKNPTLTNPYVDYSLRYLKVFIFLEILVSYNEENY